MKGDLDRHETEPRDKSTRVAIELLALIHSFHQRLGILSLSRLFVTPTANQVPITRAATNWTVDRICSAVHRGVSRDGRFVGGDARNQEPDGDTRHRDSDLDRFGPSDRRNTQRPLYLVYCIEYMMSSRGPLPLLIYSGGAGLQVKYPIWYYTMSCGARRARLDLVGWVTSDGATHVVCRGYPRAIPP